MAIRVELCGRLTKAPEVRTTPAGTPVIRLAVNCGSTEAEFMMEVVITGDVACDAARRLRMGESVKATGTLRQVRSRSASGFLQRRVEVLAESINPSKESRLTDRHDG